jgi:hypothetical protein
MEVRNNTCTIQFAFGDVEFGGSMIEEEMQREVVLAYESSDIWVDFIADSRSRHIILQNAWRRSPAS